MTPRRLPFTPPDPYEVDIHSACADALNTLLMRPAEWCCYPAGHVKLERHQVARLARVGLKRGYPDIMVFYDGGTYGLELKRHGGSLSKTFVQHNARGSPVERIGQEDMFPRLIASGWRAIAVVRSVSEMLTALERWQIPLRGRVAA